LAEKFSLSERNVLNLVHSGMDLSKELYEFGDYLHSLTMFGDSLRMNKSVAFANYNSENGMGYGLKALEPCK